MVLLPFSVLTMLLMCSFHFKLLCNVTPRLLTDLTTSIVLPLMVIFSYVPGFFFERNSQFLTFLYLRGALDTMLSSLWVGALNTQVDKLGLYACEQAVKQRWRLSTE